MVGMPRISCLFRGAEPCIIMLTLLLIMPMLLIIMLVVFITVQFQLVVDGVFAAPLSETSGTQLALRIPQTLTSMTENSVLAT